MKALADINGRPMIAHVVERAQRIKGVDQVVIATVPADQAALTGWGCEVYAPAIADDDVLARYSWVKTRLGAHLVVRITGDCPMFEPDEASAMIEAMLLGAPGDYITNRSSLNDGLDVEVVTAAALHRADDEATLPYDREHVTSYIYEHSVEKVERTALGFPVPTGFEAFSCRRYEGRRTTNGEKWSVDTPADLELVRARMGGGA